MPPAPPPRRPLQARPPRVWVPWSTVAAVLLFVLVLGYGTLVVHFMAKDLKKQHPQLNSYATVALSVLTLVVLLAIKALRLVHWVVFTVVGSVLFVSVVG